MTSSSRHDSYRCKEFASSFLAVLLAATFAIETLAAAEPPMPDCQTDPACLALKEQAAELSRSGKLAEALRLYQLAYQMRSDPRLFFNIARVLHKQGKLAEAAPYYEKFIAAAIQDEEQQQRAREYLEQIQASSVQSAEAQTNGAPGHPTASAPIRADATTSTHPAYKKWWFWTAIGGGVLAIATIGLGLGLSQRQPSVPPDINTYEPRF